MAVNVTRKEAVARAVSMLGRMGLPQPWAKFLTREKYREASDANDCDFFYTWCLKDNGGRDRSDYRNGSIKATRADRKWPETQDAKRVKPGDGVLLRWSNSGLPDHIGMVESVNRDGSVNTIEANTGPRVGVFNPAGVYRRTRFPANIVGFVQPPFKDGE